MNRPNPLLAAALAAVPMLALPAERLAPGTRYARNPKAKAKAAAGHARAKASRRAAHKNRRRS
jgi:hypothetical protein